MTAPLSIKSTDAEANMEGAKACQKRLQTAALATGVADMKARAQFASSLPAKTLSPSPPPDISYPPLPHVPGTRSLADHALQHLKSYVPFHPLLTGCCIYPTPLIYQMLPRLLPPPNPPPKGSDACWRVRTQTTQYGTWVPHRSVWGT